jgi:hypothetical protein
MSSRIALQPFALLPLLLSALLPAAAHATLQGAWSAEGQEQGAFFGEAISTAGDVNGDGHSDVVIGAPNTNGGQGAVFAYYGGPGGVSPVADWTAMGNFDGFGVHVATAGDVNGDGYDDLLVGADEHSNGQQNEGRVDLFLGGPSGLAPAPAWSFESDSSEARLGVVGFAGDVNGDGYDDIAMGAPGWDGPYQNQGWFWLWRGNASAQPTLLAYNSTNFVGANTGFSVGSAGDVDGDGRDECVFGEPGLGQAQIFSMPVNNPGIFTVIPDPGPYWYTSQFGYAVSTAGDVNGDGYADVLISAIRDSVTTIGEGVVHLYCGSHTGLAATPAATLHPGIANADYGFKLGCAGDVNGDGYADIVVGAPGVSSGQFAEGRVYGYYGSPAGPESTAFWLADGEQAFASFGWSLGTAGDVNGDGYADVIAGTPWYDNPLVNEGRVAIWHGGPDAPTYLTRWVGMGTQADAQYGSSLALADFDANGHSDVVVGTGRYDDSPLIGDHGRVWTHAAGPGGPSVSPTLELTGADPGDRFGEAVAGAHDTNGDGYDDLLVGAPGDESAAGTAQLFLGGAAGLGASPAWVDTGAVPGGEFGKAVAWAGDVNGDGLADVIVGAPLTTDTQTGEGAAYVYLGAPGGLQPTPVWSVPGGLLGAKLGWSVAGVGDVNRDGYSDVIVGAPGYSISGGQGAAFVYFGDASGISSAMPPWIASDNLPASDFGWAVAGGDVDGDGYSDAIVGAPQWSEALFKQGRVAVYTRAGGSFDAVADHEYFGGQAVALFGTSVAAADLDQDGMDEILGGQPYADNGQTNEGQVLCYKAGSTALYWGVDGNFDSGLHGSAIATRGDVNGDGFPDVLTGLPGLDVAGLTDIGNAILWYGNGGVSHLLGEGRDRRMQARWADDSQAIGLLGEADQASMAVKALGRSAMGRDEVALEVEVKELGQAFDGTGTSLGNLTDTGAPAPSIGSAIELLVAAAGLPAGSHARWRARFVSQHPFAKRSPWFSPAGNAREEADVLADPDAVAVGGPRDAGQAGPILRFLTVHPVPLAGKATIRFELSRASRVKLAIYDVAGARRAVLLDDSLPAGVHQVPWDATGRAGSRLASGVYFAVCEASGERRASKVAIVR